MKLKNAKTGSIVSHNIYVVTSLKGKLFGLVGANNNRALILHTRFGIHTFGMHSPIDVLILDKQNKVVKLKSNLKPNRIFLWNPRFQTVIELPQEVIKQTGTRVGDIVILTSKSI